MPIKRFHRVYILFVTACVASVASAQPKICYLPTESNVSYSQVLALPSSTPNQILSYGESPLQFGELWMPPIEFASDVSLKSPLVILIHGGCWLNEFDVQHTHALSTALSRSGYAVWAPEYRRSGDEGGAWPGSFDDILQSIDFITKQEIAQLDSKRIALVGHSAGGHLALLAGAQQPATFSAVIGLAAIVDLADYATGRNSCETAAVKFMQGSPQEKPAAYLEANPIHHELHPNTVLLHGSEDSIVAVQQAQAFPNKLQLIEGAGHFDMLHSGTPAFQALLKQLAKALP